MEIFRSQRLASRRTMVEFSERTCEFSKKSGVLMVGNFLSSTVGTRSICEELAGRLTDCGWSVVRVSEKPGRVARVIDMIYTAWRKRHEYEIAQIDVFSGLAFAWAEAVCWILRRARKPYILTLHGGNLPSFAKRWPRRVRSLLHGAAVVTVPSSYLLERMSLYRWDLSLFPNPLDMASYNFRPRQSVKPEITWLRAFHRIYNPTLAPRYCLWSLSAFQMHA